MKKIIAAVLLSTLFCLTSLAHATQTDNHGIHAVPAPKVVNIDGKLDEWDTSGQILVTYDLETLRDVYSAQVSAMYDAQNFYLAIHWKDATPMGNSHDPRYQANNGWAGDAVQLRFKTDRISHVTAWYYAPKQEPALQISYGKSLTEPFGGGDVQLFQTAGWKMQQGAEMAFLKDADGKGYVQEIKLPWALITKDKKFGAGDQFSLGMEFLWGQTDWPEHRYADNLREGATSREFFWTAYDNWGPVFLEPKGNLKLPEPEYMANFRRSQEGESTQGPVEISYTLPKDARVSLAIEDEAGQRIRNLVPALPRKKGRNVEKWDGLNDAGKPVDPGKYHFKAIYHDGIHANYVMSFANPGNPSWSTDDGRGAFYGDHTAPQAAAAAGKYVALACPMGEAGKHLIGLDLNGQRLWGLNNRTAFDGGHISLATDGKTLWVANEGQESTIYRVDIATGKYKPWNVTVKDEQGNDYKVLDLKVPRAPNSDRKVGVNMSGIAYKDGLLAVCYTRDNAIKLLDSETGEVKKELSINSPKSVTFLNDGDLLALSQGSLMRLAKDGTTTQWSQSTFMDAYSVTTDAAGQVYLSVRGDDQNVKVFSPAGVLLREIGQRGGRPDNGPFNANAMRQPAQIAVDSQNRLWVTEETWNPKRTSVWDTATGGLVKDLSGTTSYAGAGSINPFDPTMGFADNTVYHLDWQKGTFQPVWSLAKRDDPNDLFPPVVHDLKSRVVKRGDLTYVFTSGAAETSSDVHCTIWDGKIWRSGAQLGVVHLKSRGAVNPRYQHPAFEGHDGEFYAWADENGDGLVQTEEVKFAKFQIDGKPAMTRSYYWGQLPDAKGTVCYMADIGSKLSKDRLLKFSITGTTPIGAPIYDLSAPQIVKLDRPILGGGNGEGMLIGGSEGRVYINQNPIVTVEKDGRVVGGYPNKNISVHGSHNATAARPGYIIGPSSFLGTADIPGVGEVFYLNGNLGENYLFTEDGLYIQTLFKDTRGYFDNPMRAVRGMPMDNTTAGGESFGGNFVRAANGKVLLTLGGTDAKVMEISGLESIKHFDGQFQYTPKQYAEAQAMNVARIAQSDTPKIYTIKRAPTPANIDGKSTEWPELLDESTPLIEIQDTPRTRYARVAMRYDDVNLYLGYRVYSPRSQMKNAGQDERLMFKTGDAVDLMLGPEKSSKGEGNLRLLLTRMADKPLAVVNQKVAPRAPQSEKYAFTSPWRAIEFDRVFVAPEVKMETGPIKGGYFVEAAIPWSTLGVTPRAGLKLRGDAGVLFGDAGGTQTVSRQYWSNKATGLVNDVPGEADLEPNLWGTFTLE